MLNFEFRIEANGLIRLDFEIQFCNLELKVRKELYNTKINQGKIFIVGDMATATDRDLMGADHVFLGIISEATIYRVSVRKLIWCIAS